MWRDHTFSQRNMAAKRAMAVDAGGEVGRGLDKI